MGAFTFWNPASFSIQPAVEGPWDSHGKSWGVYLSGGGFRAEDARHACQSQARCQVQTVEVRDARDAPVARCQVVAPNVHPSCRPSGAAAFRNVEKLQETATHLGKKRLVGS